MDKKMGNFTRLLETALDVRYSKEGDYFEVLSHGEEYYKLSGDFLKRMVEIRDAAYVPPSFGECPILRNGTIKNDDGSAWTHWAVVLKEDAIKAVSQSERGACDEEGIWIKKKVELFTEGDSEPECDSDLYPKRKRIVTNDEFASNLTGWYRSESGPGRAFHNDPICFVYGKKLLLIWRGGLDI